MSMTTDAYVRIRDAIVTGKLEFGEHLSETQIAKALGMSKAPVRAAFIALKDIGLVNIVPQAGTYVFLPRPDGVREMSEFRALLEDRAIRLAYERRPDVVFVRLNNAIDAMSKALEDSDWESYRQADSDFHMAFIEECGNQYLLKAYHLTSVALEALRVRLHYGTGNFREQSYREHREIEGLLRDEKIDEAAALLGIHILIINDSLDTLPPSSNKGSRKLKAGENDYSQIFAS